MHDRYDEVALGRGLPSTTIACRCADCRADSGAMVFGTCRDLDSCSVRRVVDEASVAGDLDICDANATSRRQLGVVTGRLLMIDGARVLA